MNNTTSTANTTVAVKVTRGEEMRRFQFNGKHFQELKAIISQLYAVPVEEFGLQYQDDEKDRVTLSSDAELNEAIKLHQNVLRFYVVHKKSPAVVTQAQGLPVTPQQNTPALPSEVMVIADGEVESPASPPHHHHPYRGHGPHRGRGGMMRGGRFGGHPHHGPHGHHDHDHHHGPHHEHHHKRRLDKEEREAWKLEKKNFKKQRKCEKDSSSSSSSSEDDVEKANRKEMRQVMKLTKEHIKMNWAATKAANPEQWPQNRKLMIAEIKTAKKMIKESANRTTAPVENVAATTAATAVTEMQA